MLNQGKYDLPAPRTNRARKDLGTSNVVKLDYAPPQVMEMHKMLRGYNAHRQQRVRAKIARFVQTAIYPQQLTVPRQYATTREGCWVYKIMEGRELQGYKEPGARVVVQENKQDARFVISPLFSSKQDALDWARTQMGAEI